MPRKKTTRDSKKGNSDQDILKIYIDGQIEFRKVLVNAVTAISIQSETSREVVTNLRALIDKIETFEDKLHSLEKTVSKFEDNLIDLKDSSIRNISDLSENSKKVITELKDYSILEISRKKMTVIIMLFFLALSGVLGAYSLAGSKLKTEVSRSGVSIEAQPNK